MELQKNYFQYELTDGGWQQVSEWFLTNEALTNEDGECDGASERLLSIQVTEYSHDDRPDIWYKPEIVHLSGDQASRARAREQFIKHGLPAIIRQTCWADLDELRAAITKGLEQQI